MKNALLDTFQLPLYVHCVPIYKIKQIQKNSIMITFCQTKYDMALYKFQLLILNQQFYNIILQYWSKIRFTGFYKVACWGLFT